MGTIATLHNSPTYVLPITLLLATLGVSMEQRTQFGKVLSAPLITMTAGEPQIKVPYHSYYCAYFYHVVY